MFVVAGLASLISSCSDSTSPSRSTKNNKQYYYQDSYDVDYVETRKVTDGSRGTTHEFTPHEIE
eukprot:4898466-Amphidinium_carterae.1